MRVEELVGQLHLNRKRLTLLLALLRLSCRDDQIKAKKVVELLTYTS